MPAASRNDTYAGSRRLQAHLEGLGAAKSACLGWDQKGNMDSRRTRLHVSC